MTARADCAQREPREYQSAQRAKIEAGSQVNTPPSLLGRSPPIPIWGNMVEPEVLFNFGPIPDME